MLPLTRSVCISSWYQSFDLSQSWILVKYGSSSSWPFSLYPDTQIIAVLKFSDSWQKEIPRKRRIMWKRLLTYGTLINCVNFLSVLLLFFNRSAYALQYNVTIDDQTRDPTNSNLIQYSPVEEWTIGQICTDCDLSPALRSDAYLGTWMNATYETDGKFAGHVKQASITFEGTLLYFRLQLFSDRLIP